MSNAPELSESPWWRTAVTYQIYVRSFADDDGDGLGDLAGIRSRLGYLSDLGVDAVWITPFYPTPDHDHGYDVADYYDIDPRLGDLATFDALLAEAHKLGIRVIVDLVPNHSSNEHPWFRAALSNPDGPEHARYLFAEGKPGGEPPNNWGSVFGGAAWTRTGRGDEWYLHLFTPEQPDLNWRNPEVVEEFDNVLRFWLDRGVDGIRIDVAHGLLKDAALRDNPVHPDRDANGAATFYELLEQRYTFDQEEVHDIYRRWRALVDAYPGDRALVGEVFLWDPARVARYVRPDELHLAFNFFLLGQHWDATDMRQAIDLTLGHVLAVGATPTWVLSNHDVVRHATRYGAGRVGQRRARAAALLLLGLPGAAYLYQGEELGLEEVDVPDASRQDPVWFRTGGDRPGRDGCRVPLPWTVEPGAGRGFGFTTGDPWLPTPDGWGEQSVEAQLGDGASMLTHYRECLRVRKAVGMRAAGALSWLDTPADVLAFRRPLAGGDRGSIDVVVNLGEGEARLDLAGGMVLSSDTTIRAENGKLVVPADAAVWVVGPQ